MIRSIGVLLAIALWLDWAGMPASAARAEKAVTIIDSGSIHMITLSGGAFIMGTISDEGQQGHPPHRVVVAPFQMAETDVTFDQYDKFARATGRPLPQDEGFGRKDRPVINVSWLQMHEFVHWLNSATGHHYRLPSEAEWEYAARGGTTASYYWGDTFRPGMANTTGSRFNGPSPVKSLPPNPFGLYDMSGNVWQAVEDCMHPDYVGAPGYGSAWVEKSCYARIARGGYYGSLTRGIMVTSRAGIGESFRSMGLGFRLAADVGKARRNH